MPTTHPVPITKSLLLRAARDIHGRITSLNACRLPALHTSDAQWEQLQRLRFKSMKASQRRLFAAAAEVNWQLRASAQQLVRELHDFCSHLDVAATQSARSNSFREIYDDLVHLEDEFDDVRIDRRNHMLTVRTESIELEGVDLGPFDIALHWSDIGGDFSAYSVIAVDPVKADGDSSVTHPHVRSDALCEGDGKALIARALKRGELFEFFILVRQVLRTYDPSGAHQTLDNWFDTECEECTDCGCCLDEDTRYSCERCSSQICTDCFDICDACNGGFCQQCSDTCASCEEPVCRGCSEVSADRTSRRCRDCIEEEADAEASTTTTLTTTEETDEESSHAQESTEAESPPPHAPVHAGCLGEALVSA